MAAGHLDKAEEIFKQGLKHHPSDVMLLHNYGCLLWEGRGEYTRAEGMLQKALKIDPGHGATVQALDDLKADKMSATVRADANAAKLLAQVEVGFHPPTLAHTLSSCFGKAPTELVLSLSLAISLAVAVAVDISLFSFSFPCSSFGAGRACAFAFDCDCDCDCNCDQRGKRKGMTRRSGERKRTKARHKQKQQLRRRWRQMQ